MDIELCLRDRVMPLIRKHWGFEQLRPMQAEAISSILSGRDSVVVLPTGGGKSLCYQAPALLGRAPTVVVSPLISLMKDQVDALINRGVAAAVINSSLTSSQRSTAIEKIRAGQTRLIYVAPERFAQPEFVDLLAELDVRNFVVDEAHCVSHWGHEFRPDYRQMSVIKQRFPRAAVHAYTATATPHVRDDIAIQLRLDDPAVLVGDVDRPNLVFRVQPRSEVVQQITQVIARHKDEAGIVYCLRRADVDRYAAALVDSGLRVLPYHAGLTPEQRLQNQNAFSAEKVDVIVATIAFGMGIDRSNIRYVIHAHMPKSIEHYQQEVGRAGRDGLEAECILFHSLGDPVNWLKILEKSAIPDRAEFDRICGRVEEMNRFCGSAKCRHAALVQYFGQTYAGENCGMCDVCLGEIAVHDQSDVIAKKILSCIARTGSFGAGHIIDVLMGSDTPKAKERGHDKLSTFGLLQDQEKKSIRLWIDQLVGMGHLRRSEPPYCTLQLTDTSWAVMRGQIPVSLANRERSVKESRKSAVAWSGVDQGLFESLRTLRRDVAEREKVPPYVIFHDSTLRGLAAVRPTNMSGLRTVPGTGQVKCDKYGDLFLRHIAEYCSLHKLRADVKGALAAATAAAAVPAASVISESARQAFKHFARGASVQDVMAEMKRAQSTVFGYLAEYLAHESPASIDAWVPPEIQKRIIATSETVVQPDGPKMKPVFDALNGEVSYEHIRLTLSHRRAAQPRQPSLAVGAATS